MNFTRGCKTRFCRIFLAGVFSALLLSGCERQPKPVNVPEKASTTSSNTGPQVFQEIASGELSKSPLQLAQAEYLEAYESYVKHLRESGPQTMDTLKALAEYQKKYQLYQLLLEEEKKN